MGKEKSIGYVVDGRGPVNAVHRPSSINNTMRCMIKNMNAQENYYAILGIPTNADMDTVKRAYRQLARRYHPDISESGDATEMKRINRAYAVLGDPEKRRHYDAAMGGVIDLRAGRFAQPQPRAHTFNPEEDIEFSGLNIFCSRGPLTASLTMQSNLGVVTVLNSAQTGHGLLVAAGSLDGKGMIWRIIDDNAQVVHNFAIDPSTTVESLRELRFSSAGSLLAAWGRLSMHVWDGYTGKLLWTLPLVQRAVSAHYSLDVTLQVTPDNRRLARIALPLMPTEPIAPSAWGVRGTDVVTHEMGTPPDSLTDLLSCTEESLDNRLFWAIRTRALSQDNRYLVTLSCAQVEHEQMIIARRWDLAAHTRMASRQKPRIVASLALGSCADCTPPYAITPDGSTISYVSMGNKILLCDMRSNSFSEIASGTMGSSSKTAISPDGEWLAVAREDSEVNEGVIDLWSTSTNQLLQKLYHPWQISALHFSGQQLLVALTDGTIQIWK